MHDPPHRLAISATFPAKLWHIEYTTRRDLLKGRKPRDTYRAPIHILRILVEVKIAASASANAQQHIHIGLARRGPPTSAQRCWKTSMSICLRIPQMRQRLLSNSGRQWLIQWCRYIGLALAITSTMAIGRCLYVQSLELQSLTPSFNNRNEFCHY